MPVSGRTRPSRQRLAEKSTTMSENERQDALDEAMAEALASVEKREHEDAKARDEQAEAKTLEEASSPPSEPNDDSVVKDDTHEHLLRLAADFENYRKRSRRELDEARQFGTQELLVDLLPVLDNFERAFASAATGDETGGNHALVDGLRMVHRQLVDVLSRHGVEAFESVGASFDPEFHDAIGQIEAEDRDVGEVVTEHERGYLLHSRLLRPARVIVVSPPSSDESSATIVPSTESESDDG